MKRDLDLCLEILRHIETGNGEQCMALKTAEAIGKDASEVSYNCFLLLDAGLLAGKDFSTLAAKDVMISRLTWQGHEFLDAARDQTHWEKAKDVAHKSSGGFEIVRSVLSSLAAEAAKAITGL